MGVKLGLVGVRLGAYLRSVLDKKSRFELGYKLGDGDQLGSELRTGLNIEQGFILLTQYLVQ